MTDIMIDIETLGKFSDSVILSIGACAFDETTLADEPSFLNMVDSGFHVKLSVQEQVKTWSRKIDDDTLVWWSTQEAEAKKILKPSPDDLDLATALTKFNDWIENSGYDFKNSHCWCRGLYFDFPMLGHAFHQIDTQPKYNLWRARDTRTVIDLLSGSLDAYYDPMCGKPKSFVKHNALHDCAYESLKIIDLFRKP